jgi:nucleoside-diphosphate-sugar epimerase
MAYKEQGYDVKIARLALAYGPGTKKTDTRVLNQFIAQALCTKHIKLMDDGSAMRTYCYVDDAAEMMLDILFKGKDVVYNVGGFSVTSILDLAYQIAFITKAKITTGEKALNGSPDNVKLDMTKTLTEFPRDFVSLSEGLLKAIEYQKELYGTK